MKVLVTGAAGFIGSNLVSALIGKGYAVKALDNLSQSSLQGLKPFQNHNKFEFVQGDVRDGKFIESVSQDVDVIYHLAAFKIPRYDSALNTLQINSQGTRSVLDAAAKRKIRVITASTSDCYGKNPQIPFSETSDLWMGSSSVKRWAYAVSKMYDEHLCFAYQEKYKLPFVIVRFFGGYGPNQNLTWWGGPQSVFINCAFRNEPMEIHGDGKQTRSFTFISDHIQGLLLCLEKNEAVGQIFNLGSTEEISIVDLATTVWRLAGEGEPKYRYISYRTFGKYEDVRRRVPDISKAKRVLGFEPKVSLEEGLKKTIDWQKTVTTA